MFLVFRGEYLPLTVLLFTAWGYSIVSEQVEIMIQQLLSLRSVSFDL